MTREIKFRGKRLDNGKWIKGYSIVQFGSSIYITDFLGVMLKKAELHHLFKEINPATVGQFTGLFDKNGTEIYESDVLGRYTDGGEIVPLSIVTYTDNGFFAQNLVLGSAFNFRIEPVIERLTVIGNIHDNPELLKAE